MLYATSGGSCNVGVDNAVSFSIIDGPIFSGNVILISFTTMPGPTYADFKSMAYSVNFKMASMDAEFLGH